MVRRHVRRRRQTGNRQHKVEPTRMTVRPEEERDADGTRRMSGGKGNTCGTPGGDGKRGVGHRPQAAAYGAAAPCPQLRVDRTRRASPLEHRQGPMK
jgi:hypothetical protein